MESTWREQVDVLADKFGGKLASGGNTLFIVEFVGAETADCTCLGIIVSFYFAAVLAGLNHDRS